MLDQFLGKAFWVTYGLLAVAYIAGFLTINTPVAYGLTALTALITFVVSVRRLEFGLLIAFAELIATSHGHLFPYARIAIFAAVMLAWGIHFLRGRRPNIKHEVFLPFLLLFAAVAWGVYMGFRFGNAKTDILNDGNAYLYVLYLLPILTVEWTSAVKRLLLQVFAGAAGFVIDLTLVILYLFTHLSEPVQRAMYTFFRDARIAELTRVVGDIFRVFLQAQFFTMILLFIVLAAVFWFWKSRRDQNAIAIVIIGCLSTLIISMSRSFWIGMIAALPVIIVAVFIAKRPKAKEVMKVSAAGVLMLIASVATLWFVLAFPFPQARNVSGFGSYLSDRVSSSDAAISSRWNLLPEMNREITEHTIFGSGFGTIIAFESDDPRVRETYPDGKWRTYAFEWGWHDALIKMGILGPVALLWIGWVMGAGLLRGFKKETGWLSIGLFAGLVALYATHVFSPYLNHPIGLGYLLFLIPFLTPKTQKASEEAMVPIADIIRAEFRTPVQTPASSSVSSLRVEPSDSEGA